MTTGYKLKEILQSFTFALPGKEHWPAIVVSKFDANADNNTTNRGEMVKGTHSNIKRKKPFQCVAFTSDLNYVAVKDIV